MMEQTYETGFQTGVILERIRIKTEIIQIIHSLPEGNFAKAILEHFSIKLNKPIIPEWEEEEEL